MRVLFLVTEDWYFCSHRLPIAHALSELGHEIVVVTRVRDHADAITSRGFDLVPLEMSRGGTRPWSELRSLLSLTRIYRRVRPDVAHHVSLKPVLYGSVAARVVGVPHRVNAITGFGSVFSSRRIVPSLLRPMARLLLQSAIRSPASYVIVQNEDDRSSVIDLGCSPENIRLIPGSGVDVDRFTPSPEPEPPITFTLVARMLADKGVVEFVHALSEARSLNANIRGVLVGDSDPENPTSIPRQQLDRWHDDGIVEWWGHRTDIPAVWRRSHVAVLPSYREGFPKSLLEAAACGRPLLATDVPGCRELVEEGVNGFLVAARDSSALAERMVVLAADAGLRARFGAAARTRVVERFSEARIVEHTLDLYEEFDH